MLLPVTQAFAGSGDPIAAPSNVDVFEINENEYIADLQAQSDAQLSQMGYSELQIAEIREFDYFKALQERASLNDETLLMYGYTMDEIYNLRMFVASGGRLKKTISGSTLQISLTFSSVSAGQSAKGKFSWKWSRVPLMKFMDSIGVAWNSTAGSGKYHYSVVSSNKVHFTYTKIDPSVYGDATVNATTDWNVGAYDSIYAKFTISMGSGYFAFSGYGEFLMKCTSGTVNEFYIDAAYGHYVITWNPNISVTLSGVNISLGFKGTADERHIKRLYNKSFSIVEKYDD